MRFLNALNKANPKVNLLADGCFTYRATFRQVQTLCFSWSSDNALACHPQAALHFMASTSLPGRSLSHSFVPPLGTSLLSYSVYLYRKVAWWSLGCFENEHSAVCSTSFRLIICIGSFFPYSLVCLDELPRTGRCGRMFILSVISTLTGVLPIPRYSGRSRD